jgi:hypothetical protein
LIHSTKKNGHPMGVTPKTSIKSNKNGEGESSGRI